MLAHRVFYLVTFGSPLPPFLHHKCERPPCVNPFHLAPKATDAEHKAEHRRTRCERGHDLTDSANVYMRRSRTGGETPQCRPCKALRELDRRRAMPAERRRELDRIGTERRRARRR